RMSAPTTFFRVVPGLYPEQAADLVCRAIVERPRTIEPWWASPAEQLGQALRGPVERGLAIAYRLTGDTASARGAAPALRPTLRARAAVALGAVRAMRRAGALSAGSPRRVPGMLASLCHGIGPAAACAFAAARDPGGIAVLDERGATTFAELHERSSAIAA